MGDERGCEKLKKIYCFNGLKFDDMQCFWPMLYSCSSGGLHISTRLYADQRSFISNADISKNDAILSDVNNL